jgi:hypothetical protein
MSDLPPAVAPAPQPPAPPVPVVQPVVQKLDDLEHAAFQASVTRMTRAGFELRSAEHAHDKICAAFLSRLGLKATDWFINPTYLDTKTLVLMPKNGGAPPEKKDEPTDPQVAASSPKKPGALAAGAEMTWEDPAKKPPPPGA